MPSIPESRPGGLEQDVNSLDAQGIVGKLRVSQTGRRSGGKPLARGALYLMLQNRIYRGEIGHRTAAEGIQFPWRWNSGTISLNLGVIWDMSAVR